MTRAQATEELRELSAGLGHDVRKLTQEEVLSWMRTLEAMPYERGRAVRIKLVDIWGYGRFPLRGDYVKLAESMTFEGQPNAGAYSQNGANQSRDTERDRLAAERQELWIQMNDDEYFDTVVLPLAASGRMWARGG